MRENHNRFQRASFIGAERHLSIHRRPLYNVGLHAHDYFEIEIILGGSGTQVFNHKEVSLVRGCTSVLTPADFHSVDAGKIPSDTWNISFDETMIPPQYLGSLYSIKDSIQMLTEENLEKVDAAANLLLKGKDNEISARPLLEYLLSLLLNPAKEQAPLSPIGKALIFIENHFRENPTLADTAKQACLSSGYFGALFKKTTGETYIQYLNARKVHCAEMLLKGGMKVSDACFASGFNSLSAFLHTFKKIKGVAPQSIKKREG